MQTNGWYKIESLVLDSNNWNHSTEETIAIQESKQITLNSFKNKITNELCAQRNCDFFYNNTWNHSTAWKKGAQVCFKMLSRKCLQIKYTIQMYLEN